jgi:outer membrane protein assembly factor BamB/plastocyanin
MASRRRRWLLIAPATLIVLAAACSNSNKNNGANKTNTSSSPLPTSAAATAAVGGSPAVSTGSPTAQTAAGWPMANRDYNNSRADTASQITSQNVKQLGVAWTAKIAGVSAFGSLATSPIVVGNTVYLQDLKSNVYAYDLQSGQLKWQKMYNADVEGPNGPAYDNGKIFVATGEQSVAALDANTGQQLWSKQLVQTSPGGSPTPGAANPSAAGASPPAGTPSAGAAAAPPWGIDIQMTAYNGTLFLSSVPGTVTKFYPGAGEGIIYALDEQSGAQKWSFDTVQGSDIWGNPQVNSGGGAWYPPAINTQSGMTYWGIGNPAPWPGTQQFPNASSRPGPNLYTNSMLAIDSSGALKWYSQVKPHDLFDLDFQASPILGTANINGSQKSIVIGSGKLCYVVAFDAASGTQLWKTAVGQHQNDDATAIPQGQTMQVFPGALGGVETPMAYADSVVYVADTDLPFSYTSSAVAGTPNFANGKGSIYAIDATNGKVMWQHAFNSPDWGAATVVGDLVFTATYDGTVYALDRKTGNEVWSWKAPDGINGWMSVVGNTLLVPAGVGASPMLIALRIGATGTIATPVPGAAGSPTASAGTSTGSSGTPSANGASTRTPTPTLGATPAAGGSPAARTSGAATQLSISTDATTNGGINYNTDTLTAPPNTSVTLTYTNDSSLPHNWHLFNGSDANAPSIAMTPLNTGPNKVDSVTFTTPSQTGSYYFHCDVHPEPMVGHLVVK